MAVSSFAGFLTTTDTARAALLPAVPKVLPAQPLPPLTVALGDTVQSVQDLLKLVAPAQAALQNASAQLQANVQAAVAAAQSDPTSAPTALEVAVLSSLSSAESTLLSEALALAAKVAQPVCPLIGAVAAETSGVSVPTMPDYSIFGPFADLVKSGDQTAASAVRDAYVAAFAQLLAPVNVPDALSPASPYVTIAQALLGLLRINWHTISYPADGGAPVVHDTPGFLSLPSLIDIDGNFGFDVCANMTVDFATGAVHQQIDRIPLADATMRADIQSQFLGGVVAPGYETPAGSRIPSMYETDLRLAGAPFATKVNDAGAALSQTMNLTSAIQYRVDTVGTPQSYSLTSTKPGGATGNGTLIKWLASQRATSMAFETRLGGLDLGVGAANPVPTSFEYCTSAKGFCSNEPAADPTLATASMHFAANTETSLSQFGSAAGKTATTCPNFAILGDAHVRGTRMFYGNKTTSPGFAWFDTDGLPVSGCLATASTTATLPVGTVAQDRLATFAGAGSAPPLVSTSGTITCPPGTAITGGSGGVSFGLSRYLCT
jgi:hypothetical protein